MPWPTCRSVRRGRRGDTRALPCAPTPAPIAPYRIEGGRRFARPPSTDPCHDPPPRRRHRNGDRFAGRRRSRRRLGLDPQRPVGRRADHALRLLDVSDAHRRRGEELRRRQVPVGEGSAALRHVRPLRPRGDDGCGRRRGARRLCRRQGTRRRLHRLRHRRPAADRGHEGRVHGRRLAQDHPVLRARFDRQHGRGPGVHPVWLPGSESRDRLGVLDGEPQHRRGRAAHRIRRCRRDDRRRHRGHGQRARHRRLLRRARAVDAQRRPRDGEPPVGRGPRRLRAGRGRGHPGARGIRAREGARRPRSIASSPDTE